MISWQTLLMQIASTEIVPSNINLLRTNTRAILTAILNCTTHFICRQTPLPLFTKPPSEAFSLKNIHTLCDDKSPTNNQLPLYIVNA